MMININNRTDMIKYEKSVLILHFYTKVMDDLKYGKTEDNDIHILRNFA